MPERLDRVTVALGRSVTISWDSRQALMARIYDVRGEGSVALIGSFAAVGATRLVELKPEQRPLLLQLLRDWTDDQWALDDDDRMPEEVSLLRDELSILRDALIDDLDDADQRQATS